jgi:hypothetical protein
MEYIHLKQSQQSFPQSVWKISTEADMRLQLYSIQSQIKENAKT